MSARDSDTENTLRLVERAAGGDRAAFEELFARHRDDVKRFVAARLDAKLQGRLDASDVVQETQLEVFQRLADYLERRPMPFHLWVRRTAYQRLLILRRRHVEAGQRAVGFEVPLPDQSALLLANKLFTKGPSPSQQAGRQELLRRVQAVLAQLAEADRELLFMRNFEDLPYEDIAGILDIDPAAARKRHGRALIRLHNLLIANGISETNP